MALFLVLVLGTLVSEDLTCISAGLLIQRGELDAATGVLACGLGIFTGDVGLWVAGRIFGAAALRWGRVARALRSASAQQVRRWLDHHAAGAIVASRFLPGTRLPLYVTAGVLHFSGVAFAAWSLAAVALWTPAIVLLTASLGDAFVVRLRPIVGLDGATRVVIATCVGVSLYLARRAAALLADAEQLRRLFRRVRVRVGRWLRWEFWPMWLFYAPVGVWVALLALRYRGLETITAANPGIPDGGTVGESKFEILSALPDAWTIPAVHIPAGQVADRIALAQRLIAERGWTFPLILKPDVGQRGVGVKLARDAHAIDEYFAHVECAVLLQPYHPGPFEAGVFYYRMPNARRGRILSITDKHFPFVTGDGGSTLEELIWAHPRYRLQAATFLTRHHSLLKWVVPNGQRFQLAVAGNHAQGTLFRDGSHLLTAALEDRIDAIAQSGPGFFVGRFDVRYSNVDTFKAGDDLAIVELNGATAESTNIYDPDASLWSAYRQLFRQWSIVFAIGAANRAAGAPVSSLRRLAALVRAHWTTKIAYQTSD